EGLPVLASSRKKFRSLHSNLRFPKVVPLLDLCCYGISRYGDDAAYRPFFHKKGARHRGLGYATSINIYNYEFIGAEPRGFVLAPFAFSHQSIAGVPLLA